MNDIFTNEIKDLLKLVTADFDKFYKETEKKSKSSGDSSRDIDFVRQEIKSLADQLERVAA